MDELLQKALVLLRRVEGQMSPGERARGLIVTLVSDESHYHVTVGHTSRSDLALAGAQLGRIATEATQQIFSEIGLKN